MNSKRPNISIKAGLHDIEERHPYVFSFMLSLAILSYLFFRVPSLELIHDSTNANENIQFVNIDEIQAQKRVVKKDISEETDNSKTNENVSRATGTSEDADAVDLAFYANVAPPRLVSKLKKDHPKLAKEMNIEASVTVALLISATGKVKHVNIIGIRLSKDLPREIYEKMTRAFYQYAMNSLYSARYSPTIIDGQKRPVKIDTVVHFRLK